jgi:hypothetical protein
MSNDKILKKKQYFKNYHKKKIEKIKKDPEAYKKLKKENAQKRAFYRAELKKDKKKYQEYLKKQRAYGKKSLSKLSAEEKYELWKRSRIKYRSTLKGKISRKKWKQSEKSKNYDAKYHREYKKNPENKKKINEYGRKYSFKRYHDDIEFQLRHRLSNVIRRAVRAQRTGKSKKTSKIVGCDFKFLISYLESKFQKGMSWKNMNKWHIDHIKPCKSFDLTKPEEQEKCFHYSNLQPLWALDNIKKGAKISPKYKNNL